jgi:hypothetical protein
MGRGLGLVTMVISLVVSAVLLTSQWTATHSNPGRPDQSRPVQEANSAAANLVAMEAERQLAAYQAEHGTYLGATVADIPGVTMLHSEATTYCLQIATSGGPVYSVRGVVTSQRC